MSDRADQARWELEALADMLTKCSKQICFDPTYDAVPSLENVLSSLKKIKTDFEQLEKKAWIAKDCKIGEVTVNAEGIPVSSEGAVFTRCRGQDKMIYLYDVWGWIPVRIHGFSILATSTKRGAQQRVVDIGGVRAIDDFVNHGTVSLGDDGVTIRTEPRPAAQPIQTTMTVVRSLGGGKPRGRATRP